MKDVFEIQTGSVRQCAHALLDPNLQALRAFFASEPRLQGLVPVGGNIAFPRLPRGVDSDALAARLRKRYSTLVVPGRFFESPSHIRISFGTNRSIVQRGFDNISRTLDEMLPGHVRQATS